MDTGFLIKGDQHIPYHISIGGVVINENKVALIRKESGVLTLPRETIYSKESIDDCLKRGVSEETGFLVSIERYLGSLLSYFDRPDGSKIEKSTLYFLCKKIAEGARNPASDEVNDKVMLETVENAIELLREQNNDEYLILQRILPND